MSKLWKFVLLFILFIAFIIQTRIPTVYEPSPSLCKNLQVFTPSKPSDFLPNLCRTIHVTHQDHFTTSVYDCGSETAEKSIFLLHGFPDNGKTFRHQIDPLVSNGYRVLIPTMRGYEPTHSAGEYHITALATDVICIAKALEIEKYDILGHDWGAIVGHTLAITNSDQIKSLVSVAVPPQMIKYGAKTIINFPSQLMNSWYMFFFQIPFVPEIVMQSDFLLNFLVTTWSPSTNWNKNSHLVEIADTFALPGVTVCFLLQKFRFLYLFIFSLI